MIRPAWEADLPEILAIYAPYVLKSTATFEYDVPTVEEFLARYRTITAQYPWLVYEEDGRILGYAYASAPYARAAYSWCAEPSVYLLPEATNRGIGTKLYAALEQILLYQGYQVMYALVTQENAGSLRFHERLGYTKRVFFPDIGFKFGRWLGLIWLEKRLTSPQIPLQKPTKWRSIVENGKIEPDILGILSLF